MKYKLINKTTQEEHLCSKVVIDGFDYYMKEKRKELLEIWKEQKIKTVYYGND